MTGDDELQNRMAQMQQKRNRRNGGAERSNADADMQMRALSWIRSVVEQFVESDAALDIESSGPDGYCIGYAYISVCRLSIAVSSGKIRIDVRGDGHFYRSFIWDLPGNQTEIQAMTRDALLEWYERLF